MVDISVSADFPRSITLNALLDTFQDARSKALVQEILPLDVGSGRLRCHDIKQISMTNMGHLAFVRHGETHANKNGFLAGISDHEPFNQLTQAGRRQATAAGDSLKSGKVHYDRILVSPLGRARETADIVAKALTEQHGDAIPVEILPVLTEHHCGVLENVAIKVTNAQLANAGEMLGRAPKVLSQWLQDSALGRQERDKLTRMQQGDMRVSQTDGESIGDIVMRQYLALKMIQEKYSGENIIIVAHSVVGVAMKALVQGVPTSAVDAYGRVNLFKIMPKHGVPELLSMPPSL